ncbi:MAG: hypothetical protein NUV78_02450 [Candidatus Zambryskibacteria bacterium]|nr:hypothetical protein [Candidatus Zambryskibacteria bacterium]
MIYRATRGFDKYICGEGQKIEFLSIEELKKEQQTFPGVLEAVEKAIKLAKEK